MTRQGIALQDRFNRPLMFVLRLAAAVDADPKGALIAAVRQAGARIVELTLADVADNDVLMDMTLLTTGDEQLAAVRQAVATVAGVRLVNITDCALESHRGGACQMVSRSPIASNTDLRVVYTPGVARVCRAIQKDPALARTYTNVANKVAIVTNGTAILGLGDIGPLAGLPVMEGKAAIFWEFVKISAEPVLINTKDPDEFVNIMEKLAIGFGAIQVEDVAAPECFQITRELDRRLPIPVMHDDQHGTATICLAGLFSALRKTGKKMHELTVAISGAGAAGTAIADMLYTAGVADVVLTDSVGVIHRGRTQRMNADKHALAERTNRDNIQGTLADAMKGRQVFIGVSQPNIVTKDMVRSMAKDPIVFALANPVSEITVSDAYEAGAAVAADGRMMNNALAYPGIFRGALDCGTTIITVEMCLAAASALADIVPAGEFLPDMMDPRTHQTVTEAVIAAAGPGTALVK
ncbi:MAG: NAD-dependent malic enzyme [Phycisphaerae bacterium]|nr:NAD-dependent malic enzyme [Phycisphaerae bacterium]